MLMHVVTMMPPPVQVDFIIGFLGVTYARAVAAPLNANYRPVSLLLAALLL